MRRTKAEVVKARQGEELACGWPKVLYADPAPVMVRNNFYKLGIYAERQVPYLPKFIHKYLLAREPCSSLSLFACVIALQLWNLHTSHTQTHTLRERIEQHSYFTAKAPQADRQTEKATTEWTLLLRLLLHMVELRQSKATGCLLAAPPQFPCCGPSELACHLDLALSICYVFIVRRLLLPLPN